MDLNKVDSQMKLFQEGGIADDGMGRDPVSGNEVPPGSLASEVRDDIDAKLSEGEYVVPADVVRYYGVAYFEKLRNKAKQGLADMEADGRIGGEPMPEGLGDEDDLPFSDEELMFTEDEPLEMAEGGAVASKFNPQAFQPGFSFGMDGSGAGTTGGVVTKTYRNAAGEVRSIMFVNGQPIQAIPAGFYEDTPENRAKFETPESVNVTPLSSDSKPQEEREGGLGTDSTDGGFAQEGPDIGSMSASELADFAQNEFQGMQDLAQAATVFGGPLGTVAKSAVSITGKEISNRAQELGVPNPLGKDGKKGLLGRVVNAVTNKSSPSEADMAAVAPPGMSVGVTSSGQMGYVAESGRGGTGRGGVTDVTGTPSGFAPDSIAVTGVPESVQASIAAQRGAQSSEPSISSSGRGGGGGSSGSSGGPSGDAGEAGYGGGYGGYAARGMLVDKKVRQKQQPKPEGKGLVKRKSKK